MTKLEREVILVTGKTGQGKTLWTRRYLKSRRRVIINDPMLEYEGLLFDDNEKLLKYVEENRYYQVRTEFPEDVPDLSKISMYAGRCEHRGTPMPHKGCTDICFVVDEAGRAIPSRTILDPGIEDVIYRGRHRHVTFVNVTQRASTLNIAARAQWTRLITFWQTEDADVKWLQSQAGEKIPVDKLTQLEYFDITPLGVQLKKIVPDGVDEVEVEDEEAGTSESSDREAEELQ